MTVGELSRLTGLSPKAIRQLEGRGLLYSAGRSRANYRLFDDSALWCVRVVRDLRSLGLTLREVGELARVYLGPAPDAVGPRLASLLERAEGRIDQRLTDLELIKQRISDFREQNADALAGTADLAPDDPSAQVAAAKHRAQASRSARRGS